MSGPKYVERFSISWIHCQFLLEFESLSSKMEGVIVRALYTAYDYIKHF